MLSDVNSSNNEASQNSCISSVMPLMTTKPAMVGCSLNKSFMKQES